MTERNRAKTYLARAALAWTLVACADAALAQWSGVPLLICTAPGDQFQSWAVPDGQGGAILVWVDYRASYPDGLYAQRVTHEGVPLWGTNGVPVPGLSIGLSFPSVESDGHGGVLVATTNVTGVDITAQRLGPDGQALWSAAGVSVPAIERVGTTPVWVADGSGGGILAWPVRGSCDVHANRIGSDGTLRWSANGVSIREGEADSTTESRYYRPMVAGAPDGSGGAIVVWEDYSSLRSIRAQRVDSTGTALWLLNGVALCDPSFMIMFYPVVAADGAGGAVIAWQDNGTLVFAQKIDANGQPMWASDGVVICDNTNGLGDVAIAYDGSGGALISWSTVSAGKARRHVQRVHAGGAAAWNAGGRLLGTAPTGGYSGSMVADGAGGALCTWLAESGTSLYAQRVDGNCNLLWQAGGTLVASGWTEDYLPAPTVSDGSGGLITVWGHGAAGNRDLSAQRVNAGDPLLPVPSNRTVEHLSLSVAPNPSHGATVLFAASGQSLEAQASILDVHGRLVRDLGACALSSASQSIRWDGLDGSFKPVGPGVYFARLATRDDRRIVRFAVVR